MKKDKLIKANTRTIFTEVCMPMGGESLLCIMSLVLQACCCFNSAI